jgi:hypothetical protein
VDVVVAQTISVTENRHVSHTLAVANKFIGSTRNDKINVLAELEERIHSISGCDKLN